MRLLIYQLINHLSLTTMTWIITDFISQITNRIISWGLGLGLGGKSMV